MGTLHSVRKDSFDANSEVNFDHFQILRAIGKGSFGKVCIVQKKDTKMMYAMKYMNKAMCIEKDAVRNVFREVEILSHLEHPFLVNLWFTFQDAEDMFMVVDLLLGGDLRYHLQQAIKVEPSQMKLYVAEIALALDYLQQKSIVHRDIKPDNVLLDELGHVHITDFNIATVLPEGQVAVSLSGTRPYMAPEVYACAFDECPGYGYPVDWWSLGICAYEMLRGKRPYDIHNNLGATEIQCLFQSQPHYPSYWEEDTKDLVQQMLISDPNKRLVSLESLKNHPNMADINFDSVLSLTVKPTFVPSKEQLNCDPTYELEEMIIESKPLHKKKKRLAKQNSKREHHNSNESKAQNAMQVSLDNVEKEFTVFNRHRRCVKEQERTPEITRFSQKKKLSDTLICDKNTTQQCNTQSNTQLNTQLNTHSDENNQQPHTHIDVR